MKLVILLVVGAVLLGLVAFAWLVGKAFRRGVLSGLMFLFGNFLFVVALVAAGIGAQSYSRMEYDFGREDTNQGEYGTAPAVRKNNSFNDAMEQNAMRGAGVGGVAALLGLLTIASAFFLVGKTPPPRPQSSPQDLQRQQWQQWQQHQARGQHPWNPGPGGHDPPGGNGS